MRSPINRPSADRVIGWLVVFLVSMSLGVVGAEVVEPNSGSLPGRLHRASVSKSASSAGIDLLQRYPTTLTAGDANPANARPWAFTVSDVFHLTKFNLQVGEVLRVETGEADVGIGHCVDGAVWAVVIPRGNGVVVDQANVRQEAIAQVWLRFHPAEIGRVFPQETVLADGDTTLVTQINVIAIAKIRASWHAGLNAMIPAPEAMTVDVDTQDGARRFFVVDTQAQTAEYIAAFEQRAVRPPPAITPALAEAAFDQLWQTFDRDYAMFVLRPEMDWAKLRDQYRPLALAGKSTYAFAGVCAEMLKPLRDLHVWLTVAGASVPVFDRPRPSNANPNAYRSLVGVLQNAGSTLHWAVTTDQIGFIVVDNWTDQNVAAEFAEVLEQMRSTRGLIIDLRLNGGGSEPLAQKVAGRFLDRVVTYSYSQFRQGPQHTDLTAKTPRTAGPVGPWRYNRPVVLLIGQRCMSSGESFVAMMAAAPPVVTMGDRTAGSSGNPKIIDLPLEITVSVPQWIDYLADGKPLDERGISPQVPFIPTAESFLGERDDLLSAALERLKTVPLPDQPIESRGLVLQGQWPGYRRGSAQGVAVSGNYAFVAAGGLHVIDISDPANPQRIGGYETTRDATAVAVSGKHAYVLDFSNLYVLDLTDPTHPGRLGSCDIVGWGNAVVVAGNYAYVGASDLLVIDISDPARPQTVGKYITTDTVNDLAISGNLVYAAAGESGLSVIDVSLPSEPREVGRYDPDRRVVAVALQAHYALVVDSAGSLDVVDVSEPTSPQLLGRRAVTGWGMAVAVSGNHAYVLGKGYLEVIDFSDPALPRRVGDYDVNGYGERIVVAGSYAFMAASDGGLQVIHIGLPTDPQWVGWFNTSSWVGSLAVAGNLACATEFMAGMQVLDVSDPSHPEWLSTYTTDGDIRGIALSGNYAFAAGPKGLEVISLMDAVHPQRVAQLTLGTWPPEDLVVSGNYAYLVDTLKVFYVVDITQPAKPRRVGMCQLSGHPAGLAVSGPYVLMACDFNSLLMVDISDPTHPAQVGAYSTSSYVTGVAAQGHFAYLAVNSGFMVIDISNPRQLRLTGSYRTEEPLNGLAVSGNFAYLAGWFGVEVVDISNPAQIQRLDGNNEIEMGSGVVLSGEMAYVMAREDGLMVLDRYLPPLRFEPPLTLDDAGFRLTLWAEADQTVRLQRSPDLRAWEDWMTVTGTGGPQVIVDPSASAASNRFYRMAPVSTPAPTFRILWYSSWGSWESIHRTDTFGYSEAALIAEALGAANEEVEEDTPLTSERLSAYDAVIFMNVEAQRILKTDEPAALRDYLATGKSILVIGQQDPGTALSQEARFANSVTLPYGIRFTTGEVPDATDLAVHPITQGLKSVLGGGSVLQVTDPAQALAPAGAQQAVLAVSTFGSGRIVAISDDAALANLMLDPGMPDSADRRQLVSNVLRWLLHL